MCLAVPGVLFLLAMDPAGREGDWMADALEEPLGAAARIKCVLLQGAVPTAEAALVPSTDLARGQGQLRLSLQYG